MLEKKIRPTLFDLRSCAARALGFAALDLFPSTYLVGGEAFSSGFYYDFVFPFAFQESFYPLLEEKMKSFLKEKKEYKIFEMVPFSAKEYFYSIKQPFLAEKMDFSKNSLVQILKIGLFFHEILQDDAFLECQDKVFFKLLDFEPLGTIDGMSLVRIYGTAYFDKENLKEHVKKKQAYKENSHVFIGEKKQFFSIFGEEVLWKPNGTHLLFSLKSYLQKQLIKQNYFFLDLIKEEDLTSYTQFFLKHFPKDLQIPFRVTSQNFILYKEENLYSSQGLFNTRLSSGDRRYIFCEEKQLFEECISSLQFMMKTFKLLGFEYQLVLLEKKPAFVQDRNSWEKSVGLLKKALKDLSLDFDLSEEETKEQGPRLEWRVKDALDRKWVCSFLKIDCSSITKKLPCKLLVCSSFSSIEKVVALLLENMRGVLPFWLKPQQIRLIPIGEEIVFQYASGIKDRFLKEGIEVDLDVSKESLSQRVHKALVDEVPLIGVIGEKEMQAKKIMLRVIGADDKMFLTIDDCLDLIIKLKAGSNISELQNQ